MRQRLHDPAVFLMSWQMEVATVTSMPISLESLTRAWTLVVQKHSILRNIFLRDTAGVQPPLQVVLDNVAPTITIASAPDNEMRPDFKDTNTPVVDDCFLPHRALFSRHGDRYYINIEMDHQVIDGWSLKLIKAALLGAHETADVHTPDEAPLFRDFIATHSSDRVEADDRQWTTALEEQKPSLLPQIGGSQRQGTRRVGHKTVIYLPEIKTAALTTFSVRHGITAAKFNLYLTPKGLKIAK